MREHMQNKNTKFSGNCTGRTGNTSKNFQKKLLLQCKILPKKKKLWFACNFKNVFSLLLHKYNICIPSFDNFMLQGFHAILIVFPHLLQYALVTCWFTFSTKLAFTEGPFSGSAQGQPPSYTGHSMG
jgi:hypothetical protein